jgi:hypothetical protein
LSALRLDTPTERNLQGCETQKGHPMSDTKTPEFHIKSKEWSAMNPETKEAVCEMVKAATKAYCSHNWIGNICSSCGIGHHIWQELEVKRLEADGGKRMKANN